ncbi:S1C family serine protease [Nocardioides bruguierae]|uniref:S1C family serine protease n=1 Tax=Nocardioides bruguierae TaxID=2945102 RepID=A0A9X2DBY9_9ACTN|nr:trypsin-like peptidase domain-containing protein [Nocardioides bruguierae]MCM0622880.1 S1C family serine protease [Nocardioides bruguierae]
MDNERTSTPGDDRDPAAASNASGTTPHDSHEPAGPLAPAPVGSPHVDMPTSSAWAGHGAPAVAPVALVRPRRRRARQAIAVVAVAGVVAAGLGFATGRVVADGGTTTAASSTTQTAPSADDGTSTDGGTSTDPWSGSTDGSTDGGSTYGYGYGGTDGSSGSSGGTYGYGSESGSSSTVEQEATATDATDAQSQGLVLITTTLTDGEAAGSGMVLTSDGLVLTNYHVVEDSTDIQVEVATTGETYTATVVGHDAENDVALLQLDDASGLTTVTIDDDGDAAVGDDVTAVGNAEGQGYLSASDGTVTATDQQITTQSEYGISSEDLDGLLQTDVAVVGGYSGGAMEDADGEIVGMTTAASSGNVAESYAIPIEDALAIVSVIESGTESGTVQIGASGYLGVSIDANVTGGASVAEVESGSPADDAGITAGSLITKVGGTTVDGYDDLASAMDSLDPGDTVKVTWSDASGTSHSATVTVGSSPIN